MAQYIDKDALIAKINKRIIDALLVLKNGTRYNLNAESYNKVMNLINE